MIYRFEKISEFDQKLLSGSEPFVEFYCAISETGYTINWTVHSRVKQGVQYKQLRTYKLEELKQGFICTNFETARQLSFYLNDPSLFPNLELEYDWLKSYVSNHPKSSLLSSIAIPISVFIEKYADDFKMLSIIDYKELFISHNIIVPNITDV